MNSEKYQFPSNGNSCDIDYHKNQVKSVIFLILLAVALICTVLLSLRAGSYNTPVIELIKGLFGTADDEKINIVIRNNRLPRILTSVVAGAGLGVSGCVMQAILRNPLASASTLGVSQGAGFGAAFAIIVLNIASRSGLMSLIVPICAFAGSMGVALLILGLSQIRKMSPEGIVLSGVAISAMFTGATTLMQYFADEVQLTTLMFWTFGDAGTTRYKDIIVMSVVVIFTFVYAIAHRWDYNALLSGAETAVSLGINVRYTLLINMLICCFTASTIVSYIGIISFIGLIAPHIVRLVVGNNHVYLLPGAFLAGAVLLLLGDLISRVVISPIILPIGAITSFLGGPLFLYLLLKGGRSHAGD